MKQILADGKGVVIAYKLLGKERKREQRHNRYVHVGLPLSCYQIVMPLAISFQVVTCAKTQLTEFRLALFDSRNLLSLGYDFFCQFFRKLFRLCGGLFDYSRLFHFLNRRFIHIELTDVSKNIEMPVREVVTEVDKNVLEQFSEEEIAMLKNMLRKITVLEL